MISQIQLFQECETQQSIEQSDSVLICQDFAVWAHNTTLVDQLRACALGTKGRMATWYIDSLHFILVAVDASSLLVVGDIVFQAVN